MVPVGLFNVKNSSLRLSDKNMADNIVSQIKFFDMQACSDG